MKKSPELPPEDKTEWLPIQEASVLCADRGYNVSHESLRQIFLKFDLGKQQKSRYLFSKTKLTEYLDRVMAIPSEDEVSVTEAAKKLHIPAMTIYFWVSKNWISFQRYGGGKGNIYVKLSETKQFNKDRNYGQTKKQ